MSVRYYARRTRTGEWLDTDVQIALTPTWGLNGTGTSTGSIPRAYVQETAADGLPMWFERGTTLYREENGLLDHALLCSYARSTEEGLEIEFTDLFGGFNLIEHRGRLTAWEPDPFWVVRQLLATAQATSDGNLGFVVTHEGEAPRHVGDDKPPAAPAKPPRKKKETKDAYDNRLLSWEKAYDTWEGLYGDREPYSLNPWDAQYVADEIRDLADEVPFQFVTRYEWADRAALAPRHIIHLTPVQGRRRTDVGVFADINLTEPLDPRTNVDTYGNRVIGLGAGDGPAMLMGEAGVDDGRIRTTRFRESKTIGRQATMTAFVGGELRHAQLAGTIEQATVTADSAAGIAPGDEIPVEAPNYSGWAKVVEVTRPPGSPTVLKFWT